MHKFSHTRFSSFIIHFYRVSFSFLVENTKNVSIKGKQRPSDQSKEFPDVIESQHTDTESSSLLGFPRRRPMKVQDGVIHEKQQIEMVDKQNKNMDSIAKAEKKTQETEFMPKRQGSPVLYPQSPRALKNLNATSHQSPSKEPLLRQFSTTSRASSTVCYPLLVTM